MQPQAVCSAACPIHRRRVRRVGIGLRAARALCEFRPAPATFTATISVGLMGIVAGGIVGGPLGDRFGRRTVLLASLPVFAVVGTLATALGTTQETMFVLRLIVCPGIGGLLPNLMALTTEYAPARLRIAVTTFVVGALGIGGVAEGLFAASVIPAFGWHSIFIGRLGGRSGRPLCAESHLRRGRTASSAADGCWLGRPTVRTGRRHRPLHRGWPNGSFRTCVCGLPHLRTCHCGRLGVGRRALGLDSRREHRRWTAGSRCQPGGDRRLAGDSQRARGSAGALPRSDTTEAPDR